MSSNKMQNKRARAVALIVGSSFFMVLLDAAIIATSLPRMAETFNVSAVELSIGISIYILSVATFVPLSGWLSDRFGARRIFLIAIVIFSLASLACGSAITLWQFVLARALQGVGGAFMTPVGRVLVLSNTRKSELIQATALITWPALIAPVIGPVVGGFITTYFSWRWNFLINVPLGVIAFTLAWRYIPYQTPRRSRTFDLAGFLLTAAALVCLLYGLESLAHGSIERLYSGLLMVAGALLFIAAVRHLLRTPDPLLNLSPFQLQTFSLATLWAGTYIRTGINATPFLLPLLLQLIFGLSPVAAGGYVLVYFLGNLGMKTISTATLRTFGFRTVLVVNGVLCGLAIMATALFSQTMAQWLIIATLLFAGLTRSMQYTGLNTLAYADIDDSQRSSAATLSSMLQQVSMVLAIALSVLILNASRLVAARETLTRLDFQIAFAFMGALVCFASLVFLRLPPDAAAEVSGHDRSRPLLERLGLR